MIQKKKKRDVKDAFQRTFVSLKSQDTGRKILPSFPFVFSVYPFQHQARKLPFQSQPLKTIS